MIREEISEPLALIWMNHYDPNKAGTVTINSVEQLSLPDLTEFRHDFAKMHKNNKVTF